jgi:hypothetical protein
VRGSTPVNLSTNGYYIKMEPATFPNVLFIINLAFTGEKEARLKKVPEKCS